MCRFCGKSALFTLLEQVVLSCQLHTVLGSAVLVGVLCRQVLVEPEAGYVAWLLVFLVVLVASPTRDSRADGLAAAFTRANADAIFQIQDEDFAIANHAGLRSAGRMHDGLDRGLNEGIVDSDLQF